MSGTRSILCKRSGDSSGNGHKSASTLTSALQQGFGLQVHLRGIPLGGVGGAQGARVGVVRQSLGSRVGDAVQSLRAGRHVLSLKKEMADVSLQVSDTLTILRVPPDHSSFGIHLEHAAAHYARQTVALLMCDRLPKQ